MPLNFSDIVSWVLLCWYLAGVYGLLSWVSLSIATPRNFSDNHHAGIMMLDISIGRLMENGSVGTVENYFEYINKNTDGKIFL